MIKKWYLLKVKTNRLILPKETTRKFINQYIEVKLKKLDKTKKFIINLGYTRRFFIPKEIRKELNIKIYDKIDVGIKLLNDKKRSSCIIKNRKFDLLSIIPEKTMSNYKIIVLGRNNKLLCWYSTQGRPNELEVKRFINSNSVAKFLGYYQAEGGKPRLRKRTGRNLNFTNKRFSLIKDFIELSSKFLDSTKWHADVCYNKNLEYKLLVEVDKKLALYGIEKQNIKHRIANRIKSYTIKVWIANSILAEAIDLGCNKLKEYIINKGDKELFKEFMKGYLAGDGNFFVGRDKYGSLHSRLNLYEQEYKYILQYKKIMEEFGFFGKTKKSKSKNLYIHTIATNWWNLLTILELGLFDEIPHHKNKLYWAIKQHNRYRSLKYFIKLDNIFYRKDLIAYLRGGGSWLVKRTGENLINRIGNAKYKITEEGLRIKQLLSSIN